MTADPLKDRLTSEKIVAQHLRALLRLDPRLVAVHDIAGSFPPRAAPPGFAGLARIICGQQLSLASANAIWRRLEERSGGIVTAETFLALGEKKLEGVGLSRSKHRTLAALAKAVAAGDLDLAAIERLPAETAITELTAHSGIGPWTAEIYLMFCAGHPDVFPAGDLALRKAVGDAFEIDPYPDRRTLIDIAADWTPHRSTAALLFWRFYRVSRGREGQAL
jgi:DNA-3-methyladenine glycosylase II